MYLAQNSQNSNAVVMVKVLEEIKEEFQRQLDILTRVDHEHLVKLVGLCREMQPHYMILEYTDWVSISRQNFPLRLLISCVTRKYCLLTG